MVDLKEECQRLKLSALAPSTRRARKQQWRCYQRFCSQFKLKPIPCSDEQLSWYVTHLMKFMTHGSIVNYIQAVVLAHKLRGLLPPSVSSFTLKLTLDGVKRVGKKSLRSRDPVTISILLSMYNSLDLKQMCNLLFWACCLLLFRSLLRVSHVVLSPHTLRVADVTWVKEGILLTVRTSKTSSSSRYVPISRSKDSRLCPVFWLARWLNLSRLAATDYLFAVKPNVSLSYNMFSTSLARVVSEAGIKENITSHSFRHGGASFLSELGLPLSKIKERGGWKSNAVYCYLSDSLESKWWLDRKVASVIDNYSHISS